VSVNKKNAEDVVKKGENAKTAAAGSGSPSHPSKDQHKEPQVGSKQHDHDNKVKTEKRAAPSAQVAHNAKAISMRKEGTFSAETPEGMCS
jgi:hypothetical protein